MTTLLLSHAILMTLSIILTIGTTVAVISRRKIVAAALVANFIVTTTGTFIGGYLLLSYPLDIRCAVLFGYLLCFSVVNYLALKSRKEQSVPKVSSL